MRLSLIAGLRRIDLALTLHPGPIGKGSSRARRSPVHGRRRAADAVCCTRRVAGDARVLGRIAPGPDRGRIQGVGERWQRSPIRGDEFEARDVLGPLRFAATLSLSVPHDSTISGSSPHGTFSS